MQFRDMRFYVVIGIVILGIVLAIVRAIESSRFGYRLRALKQNETAAEAMGINTYGAKLLAFCVSAGLAALIGTLYCFGILYVMTTDAAFGHSIMVRVLSITIVGGMSTVWGPLVGACLLVPMGEWLSAQFGGQYPGAQDIVYGARHHCGYPLLAGGHLGEDTAEVVGCLQETVRGIGGERGRYCRTIRCSTPNPSKRH